MSFSKDDERLLAYALGELGADEAKTIEAAIEADPELRAEVESLREVASLLREGLEKKGQGALTEAQKKAVEDAAKGEKKDGPAKPEPIPVRKRLGRIGAYAAAATLAIAAASMIVVFPQMKQRREQDASMRAAVAAQQKELAEQQQKVDELQSQLADAKDEATRNQVQAQLEQAQGAKMKGGGGKPAPGQPVLPEMNTESYAALDENPFIDVATDPRSTFSIDVDTASYSIVRRFLEQGKRPPKGAVRIEELVNYFPYDDAGPSGDAPFAVRTEVASAPWAPSHRLVRIALKGKPIDRASRPGTNLVFLIDVSGSMDAPNKLPLLKRAFSMLVSELDARDKVSIVVYAGASGLVLPPTSGADKPTLLSALDKLSAGGSTNGGQGIELAYAEAQRSFIEGGQNRVVLATDGDFNVGTTDRSSLVELVQKKAKSGVFLSVLGFGMGNYKDDSLEALAQHGNGNYAYIDSIGEARKVLVEQMTGTLLTIAKDVKIQIEWNPLFCRSFRLIGYENRILAHRDFNDDKKDAGEIGAGHSVTALYEVVPTDVPGKTGTDPLRYQAPGKPTDAAKSGELFTVKLRYKRPNASQSELIEAAAIDSGKRFGEASENLRFAAAVAELGMLLRKSPNRGDASVAQVIEIAESSLGEDPGGHRRAFVSLARLATNLSDNPGEADEGRMNGTDAGASTAPTAPAPPGELDEAAMRRGLESKVWSGKATAEEIRMLIVLCRHQGDIACKNRARRMLEQKVPSKCDPADPLCSEL